MATHTKKIPSNHVTAALAIGILILLTVVATLAHNAVAKDAEQIAQLNRCAKPHVDWLFNVKTNAWQKIVTCSGWKPGQAPE